MPRIIELLKLKILDEMVEGCLLTENQIRIIFSDVKRSENIKRATASVKEKDWEKSMKERPA